MTILATDKIKDFKVYCYSKYRVVLSILLPLLFLLPVLLFLIRKGGVNIVIGLTLLVLVVFSSLFLLPKILARATLLIKVEDRTFTFEFIKPFRLSRKRCFSFKLSDVEAYKTNPSHNWTGIVIRLHKGVISLLHSNDDSEDDFKMFIEYFEKEVLHYNTASCSHVIKKSKVLMEDRRFLIFLSVLIIGLFIGFIILLVTKEIQNPRGFIFILAALPSIIWLINKLKKGLWENDN